MDTLSDDGFGCDDALDLRQHGGADAYLKDCPSRMVLDLIANKWALLAVNALSAGRLRHGELRRRLDGISPKMLSQTLRVLERHGVLMRTQYPTIPPQVDYELTELGFGLRESVAAIKAWAEANADDLMAARQAYDDREPPAPWYGSSLPVAARA